MSETEKTSGFGTPGPDTFNFDNYVSGKSTLPTFSHTVYLDQDRGVALNEAIERYDELVAKHKIAVRRQENTLQAGSIGLVDDEFTQLVEGIEAFEAELKELEEKIKTLESEIFQSSITLNFQASSPKKFGAVVRKAEKEYEKKHGKGSDDDFEYVTGKTEAVLAAQISAYCTGVTTPDGQNHPAPSKESVVNLLGGLISSETMRLLLAVNKGLDASGKWAERIDAGFLGRGADLARVPLGGAGAEDGEVVGGSAAGASYGEEARVG